MDHQRTIPMQAKRSLFPTLPKCGFFMFCLLQTIQRFEWPNEYQTQMSWLVRISSLSATLAMLYSPPIYMMLRRTLAFEMNQRTSISLKRIQMGSTAVFIIGSEALEDVLSRGAFS